MRYLLAVLLLWAGILQAQQSMTQDEIDFLSLPLCKIERQWVADGASMKFVQNNRLEAVKQLRKHPIDARKVYKKIRLDQTNDGGSAAACAAVCTTAGGLIYEASHGGPPLAPTNMSVVGCVGCIYSFRESISAFMLWNLEQSAQIFGSVAAAYIGTASCVWSRCWRHTPDMSQVDFADRF